ncbi:MAG TPA: BatD family protein [Mariprofundaceae bacterium]|nr:BatD family protein [Mariprofundaceae bacterium]
MVRRVLFLVWMVSWLVVPASAWAAGKLVATVNHDRIAKDHTLILSVRLNGSDADFSLDLSPLKQDFYVIPKGSGHQAEKWLEKRFQLGPKHTGVLQVPALRATSRGEVYSSQPFTVKVLNKTGDVDDARLWIDTDVDRSSVWNHQQITYRFSVFSTDEELSPKLSLPAFDGFRVEAVKKSVHEERVMNGRRVQVSSFKYLLFPKQAGDLVISGPVMHATLVQTAKGRRVAAGHASLGDQRRILRQKVARGAARRIHVRPLPADARGLPVGQIEIHSGVSESRGVAGEPLTWTVTMQGSGMLAVSLPDIKQQMRIDGTFKAYPETPDISMKKSDATALASGIWRVVLLPQTSGKMSLPSIRVPYFDPQHGRVENAVAKTVVLQVAPPRQSQDSVVFRADPSHRGARTGPVRGIAGWWKWLAVTFFLLWMGTLLTWWLSPRRFVALLKWRPGRRLGVRWVLSASDDHEQFERLKRYLSVPASLSPLGLLDFFPDLQGSESGKWLEALEKSRYASSGQPPALSARLVRQMRDTINRAARKPVDRVAPEEFGRIGRRRDAVAGAD